MEYVFDTPGHMPQFLVTHGSAGLEQTIPCAHDHAALSLHLISDPAATGSTGEEQHLQVLVPQCFAPHLFGSALAFVQASRGTDAADEFVKQLLDTYEQASETIRKAQEQGRACCEAAFRTGGREHTCRQEPQDSQK